VRRFVLIALLCAACAPPRVDFSETARAFRPDDYGEVQRRWTRSAKLYRDFSTILSVTATLKSWEYRQAYASLVASRFALDPRERSDLIEKERAAHASAHELFVSVDVLDRASRDLSLPGAPWHLQLVNERGEEVHPVKVQRIGRPTLKDTTLFPYCGAFGTAYRILFPKKLRDGRDFLGLHPRKVTLRVAGAPGRVELVWEATEVRGRKEAPAPP
jgi:hypothetical protein